MQAFHKFFDADKLAQLRKQIELYLPVSDHEFEIIVDHFEFRTVRKHQYLLLEGDPWYHDFFVIKGALRKYHIHIRKELVTQFAFEDSWISEQHSDHQDIGNPYYIEALEDTEVLQIEKDSLNALFSRVPKMEKFYRLISQHSSDALRNRVTSLQRAAEDAYREFKQQYGKFAKRISPADIASYLGITQESLSRMEIASISRRRK